MLAVADVVSLPHNQHAIVWKCRTWAFRHESASCYAILNVHVA